MHTFDLDGPDGNVFTLLGLSRSWAKQLNITPPNLSVVKQGDGTFRPAENYNEILDNFDAFWKGRIEYQFLNDPRDPEEDDDEA